MRRKKRILVTAGNTREMIDPVRYLSNISTGVMGFELSRACRDAGYATTLISGPTLQRPPQGVAYLPITTSCELERAVRREFPRCDVLFMTSAVCDFRPARFSTHKIKRESFFNLRLVETPDILKNLAKHKGKRIVVGFCLETEDLVAHAKKKLADKKLDYIVANFLGRESKPFGPHKTSVMVLSKSGQAFSLKNVSKSKVAQFLIKMILGSGTVAKW